MAVFLTAQLLALLMLPGAEPSRSPAQATGGVLLAQNQRESRPTKRRAKEPAKPSLFSDSPERKRQQVDFERKERALKRSMERICRGC